MIYFSQMFWEIKRQGVWPCLLKKTNNFDYLENLFLKRPAPTSPAPTRINVEGSGTAGPFLL
jgi:hypothetical protein